MNSPAGIEGLLTALAWVGVLILILRAGMKTRKRSVRILAFGMGIMLTAVMLWNTVVFFRF